MLTQVNTSAHLDHVKVNPSLHSRLLIVRHGANRGPRVRCRGLRPAQCQPLFDDIAMRWPDLGRRFQYWQTGNPIPKLDDVTAVLFQLQDPLLESYPDCYHDSLQLISHLDLSETRVINSPQDLSNTIKTTQAKIWQAADIPTPPCFPIGSLEELYEHGASIDAPMIIKADKLHAQKATLVVKDYAELQQLEPHQIPLPGSLSPLVDTRSGFAAQDPSSPYATHFHKKRAMVFGDHVQNNHVFFSKHPVVGCMSSTFNHFRSLNPISRWLGNSRCHTHIQSDIDFHYSESDNAELLTRAARSLGVEFCAIDYSIHADGRMVLWEANPFFSLHRWPISVLGRKRRLSQRTPRIHETAARFFRDLLSMPA